jgi:hypothetical protein
MKRAGLAVFLVALVCAASAGARSTADTITLRGRVHEGAWQRSLSIKLLRQQLKQFSLCAAFDAPTGTKFNCRDVAGASLPKGTTLRLEQSPVGKALRRKDSPGWGMLAESVSTSLAVALSNTETGNKPGTYRYRVTLRSDAGKIMLSSNVFRVIWHG